MDSDDYWADEPDVVRLAAADPKHSKDPALALSELNALVSQGSRGAMLNLGFAHEQGIGTKKDPAQAEQLYRRAADTRICAGLL